MLVCVRVCKRFLTKIHSYKDIKISLQYKIINQLLLLCKVQCSIVQKCKISRTYPSSYQIHAIQIIVCIKKGKNTQNYTQCRRQDTLF